VEAGEEPGEDAALAVEDAALAVEDAALAVEAAAWVVALVAPLELMFVLANTVIEMTPTTNRNAPKMLRTAVAKEYEPPGLLFAMDPSSTCRIASRRAIWLKKNDARTHSVLRAHEIHDPISQPGS
jgi:hypothetical protein